MGRIPQEIIDQVLDRLDIVEVLAELIPMKRAGRNFKACCPFHEEKTPSFVVSPDKQIYHCFGCGAGGNVIGFVMNYENMDFREAIEKLASRAGVEIPKSAGGEKDDGPSLSELLYKVNKLAAEYYHAQMRSSDSKKAVEYLKGRSITGDTCKAFQIGYAPDMWESLKKYCDKKKVPHDLLRKAGLIIPSQKGKGDYDRFRNRIVFPIFNERGSIIGFGGRVLDNSLPKYINSPETSIYSKSNTLYGINFARKGIRDKKYAVIVEGYMDVIIPFQYGITNVVAASGTALTTRQVTMLKKYTDTAVMVFDSDTAGEAASLRGLDILIENGMNVRIATLSMGDDPDSFIRKNGAEAFENVLTSANDLFEYKLELLVKKLGVRDIGGITDEMLPTIIKVNNAVVQSDYLKRLAERLGIHEASLRVELGKVKPDYTYRQEEEPKTNKRSGNYRKSELHLLGLAIADRGMFERIQGELGLERLKDQSVLKALTTVRDLFSGGATKISPGKLLSRFEGDENTSSAIIEAIAKADITVDHEKALNDCMFCVFKENKAAELKFLTDKLKKAQEIKNVEEVNALVIQINNLHKEKVA